MNFRPKFLLVLLAFCTGLASAQEPSSLGYGSYSTVTVVMTESFDTGALAPRDESGILIDRNSPDYAGPGLVDRNAWSVSTETSTSTRVEEIIEVGTRASVYRIGNSSIVRAALLEEGLSPRGWSIQAAHDSDGNFIAVYLRRISGVVRGLSSSLDFQGRVSVGSSSEVTTENTPLVGEGNTSTVSTYSAMFKGVCLASGFGGLGSGEAGVPAMVLGFERLVNRNFRKFDGSIVVEPLVIPSVVRLDQFVATPTSEVEGVESIIQGSIQIGLGTAVDLSIHLDGLLVGPAPEALEF